MDEIVMNMTLIGILTGMIGTGSLFGLFLMPGMVPAGQRVRVSYPEPNSRLRPWGPINTLGFMGERYRSGR